MPEQELRIEVLLEEVIKRRASDLHIQVGLPPMLRIDGALIAIAGFDALDETQVESAMVIEPGSMCFFIGGSFFSSFCFFK